MPLQKPNYSWQNACFVDLLFCCSQVIIANIIASAMQGHAVDIRLIVWQTIAIACVSLGSEFLRQAMAQLAQHETGAARPVLFKTKAGAIFAGGVLLLLAGWIFHATTASAGFRAAILLFIVSVVQQLPIGGRPARYFALALQTALIYLIAFLNNQTQADLLTWICVALLFIHRLQMGLLRELPSWRIPLLSLPLITLAGLVLVQLSSWLKNNATLTELAFKLSLSLVFALLYAWLMLRQRWRAADHADGQFQVQAMHASLRLSFALEAALLAINAPDYAVLALLMIVMVLIWDRQSLNLVQPG